MNQPLFRTREDRMVGGVAGGIARSLGVDPTLIRVAFVILAFVTSGAAVLAYFILLFVIPEEPWAPAASQPGGIGAPPQSLGPADELPLGGSGAAPLGSVPRSPLPAPNLPRTEDNRTAALVVGIILVAVGVWFLVREWLPDIDLGATWPYLAVGGGILLVVFSLVGGRRRP